MSALEPAAAAVGLRLNRAKCKLWGPSGGPGPLGDESPPALADIPWASWTSGMRILGTPVGRAPFVKSELAEVSAKIEAMLERLESLACPQSASLLLLNCLGACRIVHLLRTVPYAEGAVFAAKVRDLLKSAWGVVMGAPLAEVQWTLASLPVRLGGIGASDPVRLQAPAAIGAFMQAARGLTGISLERFPPDFGEFLSRLEVSLGELSAPLKHIWREGTVAAAVASPLAESWASQKSWSEALDNVTSSWIESEVSCRLASLKRLQSGAHSGAWLVSLPLAQHCISAFSPSEWRVLLRFRCGVPLVPRARCGGCDTVMDPFGDHALSCASCGRYARHNRLRQAVAFEYQQAGQAYRVEVGLPGLLSRPADILAVEPEEASPSAVDVSVVHPLRPSAALAASAEVIPGVLA
jgi:hypothetical protein